MFPTHRSWFRRLAASIQLFAAANLVAQDFRIDQVFLTPDGRLEMRFAARPDHYYRLIAGSEPTSVSTPVAVGLDGSLSTRELPESGNRFFRVQELSRAEALDTDGDGRSDVTELLEGTNPLEHDVAPPKVTTLTSSPGNGESDVAVTRETVVRFSRPVDANTTLASSQFYAQFGQRRLLTRIELAKDRRSATLFYLENLPGSSRVRVTFDGSGVIDESGKAVDADGDGLPGGVAKIDFETVSLTPVGNTGVIGRVYASELINGHAVNQPLEGVTITVDGAEETLRATTDSNGNFRLQPAPAGTFFVHVDGRTATLSHWPSGAYYPVVGKAWNALAGNVDNLAGGTGEIFLPLVPAGTLKSISANTETRVEFPAAVIEKNPDLAGVSIQIPPNALYGDNGLRGGRVGIAAVSPDRIPEPLPPGLNFPLVITVQTDGAGNFDRPVPVTFPNLPDPVTGLKLPPGAKTALWSFDHDLGTWVINGSMTVSADGKFVVSDPGVGIRKPGWHGVQPGTSAEGGEVEATCDPTGCSMGPIGIHSLGGGRFRFELDPAAHTPGIVNWFAGTASNAQGLSGNLVEFVFCEPGLHNITAQLSPKCGDPCSKTVTVTVKESDIQLECEPGSMLLPLTIPSGEEINLSLLYSAAEPAEEEVSWEAPGATPSRGTGTKFTLAFCTQGRQTIRWTRTPACSPPCSGSATVTVLPPEPCSLDALTTLPASPAAGETVAIITTARSAGTITWSYPGGVNTTPIDTPDIQDVSANDSSVILLKYCGAGSHLITATLRSPCGESCVQTLNLNIPEAECILDPINTPLNIGTLMAGDPIAFFVRSAGEGHVSWTFTGPVDEVPGAGFGDVNAQNPQAFTVASYCTAGSYEARATLTTACGKVCTQSFHFTIEEPPSCHLDPISLLGPSFEGGFAVYAFVTKAPRNGTIEWQLSGGAFDTGVTGGVGPIQKVGAVSDLNSGLDSFIGGRFPLGAGSQTVRAIFTDDCERSCRQELTFAVPGVAPAPLLGNLPPSPSIPSSPVQASLDLITRAWQLAGVNPPAQAGTARSMGPQLQDVPAASASVRQHGLHYYVIVNRDTRVVVARGIAGRNGITHPRPIILGANLNLRETVVQADSFWLATADYRTGENGSSFTVPKFSLTASAEGDTDGDGVPNDVEQLLGTDPTLADSDGDGVGDAEEIRGGTALSDTLGVIAAVQTPGYAVDVAVDADRLAVALRSEGVAVFNIFNGLTPALVSQVKVLGEATAVSIAGDSVLVGCEREGVAIVDVSDPAAGFVRHQIRFNAAVQSVAARAGLGFIGLNSGELSAVDLASGAEVARLHLGRPVHDLSLSGDFLYALTDQLLFALLLTADGLSMRGAAEAPGTVGAGQRRLRLHAGGNRAYAVDTRGFRVYDLSTPEQPVLLQSNVTTQFGWKQLVPDGTGVGMAAADPNSTDDGLHDAWLYNLQPGGTNALFVDSFATPGIAEALTLASGFAYVADGASGLEVVRFKRRDTFGRRPTVVVRTPFSEGFAEENKPVTFVAEASDDVQISRVEFLVDGEVVGTDTSFPYELRFTTPARTALKTSFRLRARAVDTGGNAGLSPETTLTLVADATPPGLALLSPGSFSFLDNGPVDRVEVTFAEAIRPETLPSTMLEVRQAGPDFQFNTADDLILPAGVINYRSDTFTASLALGSYLPKGEVRVRLRAGVADLVGNARTEDFTWQFTVGGPRVLSTIPGAFATSAGQAIEIRFNGPINPATLNNHVVVHDNGKDGRAGTADDVPVTGGVLEYNAAAFTARLKFEPRLVSGSYSARLDTDIADAAGNKLDSSFRWEFVVQRGVVSPGQPAGFVVTLDSLGSGAEIALTLPAGRPISFFAPVVFGDCPVWSLVDPSGKVVFSDVEFCKQPKVYVPLIAGDYGLRAVSKTAGGSQSKLTVSVYSERTFSANLTGKDVFEQASGPRVPGDLDVWDLLLPAGETFAFTVEGAGETYARMTDGRGRTLLEDERLLNRFVIPPTQAGGHFRLTLAPTSGLGYRVRLLRNQTRSFDVDLRGRTEFLSSELPQGPSNSRLPGDLDVLRLNVAPGDRWVFVPQGSFPCFDWSLSNPLGQPVFGRSEFCSGLVEADTSSGGNFTLRLTPHGSAAATYNFRLVKLVVNTFTHDLRGGQTLNATHSLNTPGAVDVYRLRFDPAVQVRLLLSGPCFEWELRPPANGAGFPTEAACNGPRFISPQTGDYELRVRADAFQSGDYQLEIRPLVGLNVHSNLMAAGSRFQLTVNPISPEPPEDSFQFDVAAGIAYRVKVEGRAPVQWHVLGEDGSLLSEVPATVAWQELFTPQANSTLRLGLTALVEDSYTITVEQVDQSPGQWLGGDLNTPLDKVEAGAFHQGALHLAGRRHNVGPPSSDELVLIRQDGNQWTQLGTFQSYGFFRGSLETNGGFVLSMVSDGTNLVVGGRFTRVNGVHSPLVASWDGSAWHALTDPAFADYIPGAGDTVFSISKFNGEWVAGGDFARLAGPAETRYAARWDGTTWKRLGGGLAGGFRLFNGTVAGNVATAVERDHLLYLGGVFTFPSGGIVAWDGTNLVATGGLFPATFLDAPYVGKLVNQPSGLQAYGTFAINQSGTRVQSHLAINSGGGWTDVPDFPSAFTSTGDGAVDAFSSVYHAENVTLQGAEGVPGPDCNGVFRWNGSKATALHNGVLAELLEPYQSGGGEERTLSAVSLAGIVVNQGDPLPLRRTGSVEQVFEHQGRIYVLGQFNVAGPLHVKNWAVWQPTP